MEYIVGIVPIAVAGVLCFGAWYVRSVWHWFLLAALVCALFGGIVISGWFQPKVVVILGVMELWGFFSLFGFLVWYRGAPDEETPAQLACRNDSE